ncbi:MULTISPECIES: VOC family protein [Rhizobium]|uniref:Catechol 2,3-dioxygenase-like lactoylglutathione lyase family enzyme n=1 Tax=Rhizobium fabae TaxID=573179 RepID=A0A7W6BCD0_9HYPH|nr:VOC family protein [Rhizobium fabae]MBB3916005.1 catechol 2,3-dioxygenase-like lactoylglutathione lyase family enzyme [Rhizobium fabae]RUM11030.1 VOC family protein [Rhizobium fabae]
MAAIRYIVNDVGEAVSFYTTHLGFALEQQFGPAMAILTREDLTLWVAGPLASAYRAMPDGRQPAPGGWNRIVLEVRSDLAALVSALREKEVRFRNDIVEGPGGRQILCEDPSGNAIELFEAKQA